MDILAVLGDALRSSIGPQTAAFALVTMGLNLQTLAGFGINDTRE